MWRGGGRLWRVLEEDWGDGGGGEVGGFVGGRVCLTFYVGFWRRGGGGLELGILTMCVCLLGFFV